MMADQSIVSVIVPVYNGESFLVEAVRSVLDQIPPPGEIVIVDDGSTDETPQIVARLSASSQVPILGVRQANRGPAAARNRGLEAAAGEILAFQDADDFWIPGRLALQTRLLIQNPAVHAVIGMTRIISMNERPADPSCPSDFPRAPLWFPGLHCGLYRRSAFEIVGTFNAGLRYHEDIDWFRRARAAGLVIRSHEDPVLLHRRHAGNMTNDRTNLNRQLLRMLAHSPKIPSDSEESLLGWLTADPISGGAK